MNLYQLAVVVCKSVGLFLFATSAVQFFLAVYVVLASLFRWTELSIVEEQYWGGGIVGAMSMARVLVGMVLWWGAERIAKYMVPDHVEYKQMPEAEPAGISQPMASAGTRSEANASADSEGLLIVALATVGVYMFVEGITEGIKGATDVIMRHRMLAAPLSVDEWVNSLIQPLLQVVFAIWLMLGSKGIARGIRWLRTARFHAPPSE